MFDEKGHFLTRKRGNNRNPGRVYYTQIPFSRCVQRSIFSLSNRSFCCRSDSNIKNFSSVSDSPIDYSSTRFFLFFTKHVIFSIQLYVGTFLFAPTFVNSFSSNANTRDLNYVSPCVFAFRRHCNSFFSYNGFVCKPIKRNFCHILIE